MQHVVSCAWILSPRIMSSKFPVVACISSWLIFLLKNTVLCGYTELYLSVDVHLACLQFGAIINNAAVKIHVQLWTYVFLFLEYIHKSGIVGFLVLITCYESYSSFLLGFLAFSLAHLVNVFTFLSRRSFGILNMIVLIPCSWHSVALLLFGE